MPLLSLYPRIRLLIIILFSVILFNCSGNIDPHKEYLVGVYYYSWFPKNWKYRYTYGLLNPKIPPLLGEYSSSDLSVIEKHISWSSMYGVKFWAISWWPGRKELDRVIKNYLYNAKNIKDIKFAIFYESYGLGLKNGKIIFDDKLTERFISDFIYIAKTYFNHPSYLKIDNKHVIVLYITRAFTGNYKKGIRKLRKVMKNMGYDLYIIGDEIFWNVENNFPNKPNIERCNLFDGITAYNMYDWSKLSHRGYGKFSSFIRDVKNIYREYRNSLYGIDFIPSLIPGYNDRGIRPKLNHYIIPREFSSYDNGSSFFEEGLNRIVVPFIDKDINMILITSWNEWNEGTQIEPSIISKPANSDVSEDGKQYTGGYKYYGYGMKYLEIIRNKFVAIYGRVKEEYKGNRIIALKNGKVLAITNPDSSGYYTLSRINLPPSEYEVKLSRNKVSKTVKVRRDVAVRQDFQ
jgi:hypothetical protein